MAIVLASTLAAPGSFASSRATTTYPVGVFDEDEPSGYAPPAGNQLPGYAEAYVDDFTHPLDFSKWGRFSGVPKGDPAGYFERGHVFTSKGLLHIGTWRDPARHHHWATGGICLCGVHPTYGAFFVRSRETVAGPDDAELLWPQDNAWPPELDIDEAGTSSSASSWTDHYASPTTEVQETLHIDVLHWHTWGVVWSPSGVTFVVDGRVWGQVTAPAEIPDLPMTLDLQSQTWCGIAPECPTRPSSLLVDWVVVYTPTG